MITRVYKWRGRGGGPMWKFIMLEDSYSAHVAYAPDASAWRRLATLAQHIHMSKVPTARRAQITRGAFSCPQVVY
eukprot:2857508-Amphidinium_carterae.1